MTIAPCPPPASVPHGVVVFVPTDFKAAYPEFATVADAALTANFGLATLQLTNSCGSRVANAAARETLLDLLTAHITQLRNGINGQPAGGLVGAISNAREGSVSVSAEFGTLAYGQAYYMQTQFGALYWQSTAKYRTMRFIPAPIVCADLAGLGPQPFGPFSGPDGCNEC